MYYSTDWQLVVKLGDVLRFHTDAAVTCGATNFLFLGRAMNINAALIRVRVLWLESAQPDDARGNRVAARSIGLKNFARQSPLMENSADWHVVTDLFFHRQITERSGHSPPRVA